MDFTNVSKSEPIEPYIELDGGYSCCYRCMEEISPVDTTYPYCHQKQDWSWLNKNKGETK